MNRLLMNALIAQGIILAANISCLAGDTKDRAPNIIIFLADDMGYGDLGCFGSPNIRTPNIDKLANEGIKLTSFYVAGPVCTPSRAGLLTGRYPIHTLDGNLGPESQNGLPANEPIISEVLKDAGYRSMAIGKWHLGHATKELLPTGRGFDHFYGLPYSNDMIPPWVETDVPLKLYIDDKPAKVVNSDQESLTIDYTGEAVKFIREKNTKPFFLYIPYSMPHLPISTTKKFKGKSAGGLYGDVVEAIDWSVGEVMKTLEEMGLDNNTLVIFASDNGPWHGLPARMLQKGVEPWHQGTAGPLHGAKGSTYEGGMRVPGIFNWKGVIPAGQISSEIVCTMDIFPTLVEITGAKIPEGKKFDGLNMLSFLKGTAASPRDEYYFFKRRTLEAVRSGQWKFRYSRARNNDPVTPELYNMKDDAGENYNVAELYPDIAKQMLDKLKKKAAEVDSNLNQ
jgi:arylsulfatase A-like enzyme